MSDLSEAEIQLLRQISEGLGTLNRRMESQEGLSRQMVQQMAAMQERVANTAKLEDQISKLETTISTRLNNHSDRLTTLEGRAHRTDGALSMVDWLNKLWPLAAALIGLVGIYVAYIRP